MMRARRPFLDEFADCPRRSVLVVMDALRKQLDLGIELGAPSELAGKVAALFCELTGLEVIERYADELAGVIVEPVRTRSPDLQPIEFLHELRALTTRRDITFIIDEVVTGFRVHQDGAETLRGIEASPRGKAVDRWERCGHLRQGRLPGRSGPAETGGTGTTQDLKPAKPPIREAQHARSA